jgi:hypothetical protein
LIGLAAVTAGQPAAADEQVAWPTEVRATYRVDFNGFDIGTFQFTANVAGSRYSAKGEAQLSALLGAFKWRGVSSSSGVLSSDTPRPSAYTFDFAGTGREGTTRMAFTGDGITSLAHSPPYVPKPNTVPVRESHLKGVLDPLSAVMAMSRSAGENPCQRRLAIFDGKQRFDLVLSYKRQERVAEARPSGQPGVAFVCRVRYQPIAGHRSDDDSTDRMAKESGIEISLRPVPSAGLFIPHTITLPTGAGPATLTSQRVDIVGPRNEQIALMY